MNEGSETGGKIVRCGWAEHSEAMRNYHDQEWGVPALDQHRLFELLILEGAQAGLSWATILAKRDGYRRAFREFNPEAMAGIKEHEIQGLMNDAGIVRNRRKIESAVTNAQAWLRLRQAGQDPVRLIWSFVDGRPVQNRWGSLAEVPAATPASQAMSRELKKLGFSFVGPTVCYALMQAAGLVNDHLVSCFRHDQVAALAVM